MKPLSHTCIKKKKKTCINGSRAVERENKEKLLFFFIIISLFSHPKNAQNNVYLIKCNSSMLCLLLLLLRLFL